VSNAPVIARGSPKSFSSRRRFSKLLDLTSFEVDLCLIAQAETIRLPDVSGV
jgi:hypothetical protein